MTGDPFLSTTDKTIEAPDRIQSLTGKPFHLSPSQILIGALVLALLSALAALIGGWPFYVLSCAGLIALVVLTRYAWALWIVLVAALAFSIEIRIPGTSAEIVFPTESLIPILVAASILEILIHGRFRWIHSRLNGMVVFLILAMLLSIIPSGDRMVSFKAVLRDLSYIVAGYLLVRRYITTPRRLVILLIARASVTLVIAIYGMFTQFSEGIRFYQMIASPFFRQYSVYAAMLAMDFALLCAFVLEYRRSGIRWLGFVLLGVWGFAIAMSFSRGAWLSLVAMAVLYLVMERRQIDLKIAITIIMLVIVGFGIVISLQIDDLFALRIEHVTDLSFLTNYDRIDRWMAALAIFRQHPFLGIGWGRYADEYFNYIYYTDAYSTEIRMGAHNLYLEMLAESGILGGLAFAGLIGVFASEIRRLRRRCSDPFLRATLAGILGAATTYFVHAFVNNLGPSDKISLSFWVLIGLVPVLSRMIEKQEGERQPADASSGH